jgi:hypothetical protein
MNTHVYKLVSGEEIIANTIDSTDPAVIKVKNARHIVIVQTSKTDYELRFAPFMRGVPDGEISLMRQAIAVQADSPKDLETAYLSQISGLEIASSLSPLMG